jgi:fructoselysine/glucoselysine PTS system EIIA component
MIQANMFVQADMNNKTRKFLIATHGGLASGFRSSLELIAGMGDAVILLQAYLDESAPMEEELRRLFGEVGGKDGGGEGDGGDGGDGRDGGDEGNRRDGGDGGDETEWVVFSDLLGGSITNQLVRAAVGKNIHIVAGFNLPLLIEVVLSDPGMPVEEILTEAIGRAREQMVYVNQLMAGKTDDGGEMGRDEMAEEDYEDA